MEWTTETLDLFRYGGEYRVVVSVPATTTAASRIPPPPVAVPGTPSREQAPPPAPTTTPGGGTWLGSLLPTWYCLVITYLLIDLNPHLIKQPCPHHPNAPVFDLSTHITSPVT